MSPGASDTFGTPRFDRILCFSSGACGETWLVHMTGSPTGNALAPDDGVYALPKGNPLSSHLLGDALSGAQSPLGALAAAATEGDTALTPVAAHNLGMTYPEMTSRGISGAISDPSSPASMPGSPMGGSRAFAQQRVMECAVVANGTKYVKWMGQPQILTAAAAAAAAVVRKHESALTTARGELTALQTELSEAGKAGTDSSKVAASVAKKQQEITELESTLASATAAAHQAHEQAAAAAAEGAPTSTNLISPLGCPPAVAPSAVPVFAMKVQFLDKKGPEKREKLRQRARQEIECLRRCQHPLVVGYVDHREYGDSVELVMELIEGGDLNLQMRARASSTPPQLYTEAEALFYFVQACVAVRSLHRRSILHRDIKSGNFLCLSNGLLKLADFGFAVDVSPATVVGQRVCTEFMGTPSFMAPEVWRGEGYGDKAEVWSLGVMLYQLLMLQLPFNGSTMQSLSRRLCRGTYLPIPTDRVTVQTRALVQWMLTVDQDKRPSLDNILATTHMTRALSQFFTVCEQRGFLPNEDLTHLRDTCFVPPPV
jgi:serine/threonine protein kinase